MGALFYKILGNVADGSVSNIDPFKNLQSYYYWSGTEYATDSERAWFFATSSGFQHEAAKNFAFYALAVRPGDVAAVPEASGWAMLLVGLGALGVVRVRHKWGNSSPVSFGDCAVGCSEHGNEARANRKRRLKLPFAGRHAAGVGWIVSAVVRMTWAGRAPIALICSEGSLKTAKLRRVRPAPWRSGSPARIFDAASHPRHRLASV